MKKLTVVLLLGLTASSWPLYAASGATGFPPYGSFEGDNFITVNRQNLNVHFSIPLVTIPGRGGTDFVATAEYDSLVWQNLNGMWIPVVDESGAPTWGWNIANPAGKISFRTELVDCSQKPYVSQHHYDYAFTDGSGTRHTFPLDFYSNSCGGPTGPQIAYASDSSLYYIDASSPGAPIVYGPDGTPYNTDSSMTDSNGNKISRVDVGSSETDWTDTVGHAALRKVVLSPSETDYIYQDSSGDDQTIHFYYTAMTVRTNWGCSGVSEFEQTNVYMLSGITLPDNRQYQFFYESNPIYPSDTTGRLRWIALPGGGTYEFRYHPENTSLFNCSDGTPLSMTRVLSPYNNESDWDYERTLNQDGTSVTQVTEPQLPYDSTPNVALYTFDDTTRETQEKIFQGNVTTGTPLVQVDTTYPTTGRTPLTKTTTLADGRMAKTEFTYDTYELPTDIKEYDWGQGAVGALTRKTTIAYERDAAYTSRNLIGLVTSKRVEECQGTSNCISDSYETTAYDTTAVTCVTGAAQHDDTGYGCSFLIRGNPTSVTDYADAVYTTDPITKTFTYDSVGNLRTAQVDCCQQKSWVYSAATQYAYPDSETDGPDGGPQLTTSMVYSGFTGQVESVTDPNNQETSYAYDLMKRPVTATRPDGAQQVYSYPDPITTVVDTPIDASNTRESTTTTDGYGRPIRQTLTIPDPNPPPPPDPPNPTYVNTDILYDAFGRVYKTSNPYVKTGNPPTGSPQFWTEARYDVLGRPTEILPQDWNATTNNHFTSFAYSGVTTTETDPAGLQRRSDYDPLGRLIKVTEPDATTGQLTVDTTYAYNALDQVKTVIEGAQTRSYVYDGLGRVTSRTTPEAGTDQFQYNSFGLVTQRTDARGVIMNYQYDSLNRLTQTSYDVGSTGVPATATVTYTYGTNPASNNNGRLISMADGTGQEAYSYDILGRITQVAKTVSGVTYPIGYGYNLADELTTLTYPSGRQAVQGFDAVGRLAGIQFGGVDYLTSPTYDAAQDLTSYILGNGVAASASFSPDRLQLTALSYMKTGSVLPSFSYGYTQPNSGNNGQITAVTDNSSPGRSASYTYDPLGRIASAETTGSTQFPKWRLTYGYDRYGNRLSQTAAIGTPPAMSLSFDAATNRITTTGYGYDATGNVTSLPNASLTYDAKSRTVGYSGSATASYGYDGHDLRVIKTSEGTTTVSIYSGSKVLAEYAAGAAPTNPSEEYTYLGDSLLASYDGSVQYYLSDELSTRAITDGTGAVTAEMGHYPFGEEWYAPNGTTKWAFTTYERDAESGIDYARARSYVPTIGRFTSPDPIGGSMGAPQTLNRYIYALNDPINLVDPLGLKEQKNEIVEPDIKTVPGAAMSITVSADPGPPIPEIPWDLQPTPAEIIYDNLKYSLALTGLGPEGTPAPRPITPQTPKCTAAKKFAARVGALLQRTSEDFGLIAFGGSLTTAILGVGEGPTLGLDTGGTITAGALTAFAIDASFATGTAATAFNSFANGNLDALKSFDTSRLAGLGATLGAKLFARKLPVVGRFAEQLGYAAEQATAAAQEVQAACQ